MECCVLRVFFAEAEREKVRHVAWCVSFLQRGNGKEMKCCVLRFFSATTANEKKRNDHVAVACCVSLLRKQKAKLKMKGCVSCVAAC